MQRHSGVADSDPPISVRKREKWLIITEDLEGHRWLALMCIVVLLYCCIVVFFLDSLNSSGFSLILFFSSGRVSQSVRQSGPAAVCVSIHSQAVWGCKVKHFELLISALSVRTLLKAQRTTSHVLLIIGSLKQRKWFWLFLTSYDIPNLKVKSIYFFIAWVAGGSQTQAHIR